MTIQGIKDDVAVLYSMQVRVDWCVRGGGLDSASWKVACGTPVILRRPRLLSASDGLRLTAPPLTVGRIPSPPRNPRLLSATTCRHLKALTFTAPCSFATCVCVFRLQKPKKLTFIGSDGAEYSFLAKPKDDLRKDYRWVRELGVEYPGTNTRHIREGDLGKTRIHSNGGLWGSRGGARAAGPAGPSPQETHPFARMYQWRTG